MPRLKLARCPYSVSNDSKLMWAEKVGWVWENGAISSMDKFEEISKTKVKTKILPSLQHIKIVPFSIFLYLVWSP